jgi:MoaA/NifB/PqqE/SkfB family radical SAM enzyme
MFHQIINNIRDFSKIKKDSCDLSVNFIVTKENYKSIYAASKLFSELNIDNVRYSPV